MNLTRLPAGRERDAQRRKAAVRAEVAEHTAAADELRQAGEQFRAITESISDLIAVLDRDGKRLYNSPNYRDILDDPIGLRGSDSFNEIHPDDQERIRQVFQETVSTGRGQRAEYRFLLRDGSIRYIESQGNVILDSEGKTSKVVVVSRDVTERKRADEALRESEEKYRSLVSNIPDVSWTLDAHRRFLFISSNVERLSGFSADEVYQNGADIYFSSLPPEDVPKVREAFRGLFTEGRPFDVEVRFKRKDGVWIWMHHRALATYEKNGIRYADGLISDITERKRAEEALRRREVMLREALLAAQMGVWEWTLSTNAVRWDENLYRIAGRDPKLPPPSYKEHPKIFARESWKRLKAAMENSLTTGTTYELDLDLVRPDGSTRWLIGRGEPLRDPSGRITHLRGTVQDITERKQAEKALERRAAFDELMAEILGRFARCPWTEVDLSVVDALHAVAEFIGADHAFVIVFSGDTKTWSGTHEWCGPNVTPRLQNYQHIPLGTLAWSERRLLADDIIRLNSPGELPPEALAERQNYQAEGARSVLDVPIKVAGGGIQGCVGFHSNARSISWSDTDVSQVRILGDAIAGVIERKRTEGALRESERKYRTLVETSQDVIWSVDRGCRIAFISPAVREVYGYEPGELLGCHLTDLVPAEWLERELKEIERVMTTGASKSYEHIFLRKDGTPVYLSCNSVALRDDQGRVIGAMGVSTDITERKRAEEELRAIQASLERRVVERTAELAVARDRAQMADRTKSAFLATMSHELRTPLNSIIGFTGLLLQGLAGPLNEEQAKQLRMVKDSGQHLLALINDVLDISKIEAGQIEIANAPFDLSESIQKVVQTVTPLAGKKRVALVAQIAPSVRLITSDRRRVEQILLNLLSNAIKFTERGEVRLTAELTSDTDQIPHPKVLISVADTGIGIKREDLDKLFQPFRQLDTGLTRRHEGTGLGLAICKRLVERLGGAITVESDWGKGSTFHCALPIQLERKS